MTDTRPPYVNINFTAEEAQMLLNIMAQAPLPYVKSNPLIQKIAHAMENAGKRTAETVQEHNARQMAKLERHVSVPLRTGEPDAPLDVTQSIIRGGKREHHD